MQNSRSDNRKGYFSTVEVPKNEALNSLLSSLQPFFRLKTPKTLVTLICILCLGYSGLYAQSVSTSKATGSNIVYIDLHVDPAYEDCFNCRVQFNISDSDGFDINNAIVTIGDLTNPLGEYTFESILIGNYNYTIVADGYHDVSGSLTAAEAEVTKNIVMDMATSAPFSYTADAGINIFPNPNAGVFTLEVVPNTTGKQIEIRVFDVIGNTLFKSTEFINDNSFRKEINLSFLSKGIYFISVIEDQGGWVKELIIN